MEQSTFLLEEHLVSHSRSQGFGKDLLTLAGILCLPILPSLNSIAPSGWYGKTSPESCRVTKEGILPPSSGRWGNSGMGSPTELLTLNTSVFHKDASVCSLSDVLETGEVQQRYSLSPTACRGILRRAEKRGKKLPPPLQRALHSVAQEMSE